MWVAFAMQKLLTPFFNKKLSMYLPYFKIEILTLRWLTTSLGFERLGPDLYCLPNILQFLDEAKGNVLDLFKF